MTKKSKIIQKDPGFPRVHQWSVPYIVQMVQFSIVDALNSSYSAPHLFLSFLFDAMFCLCFFFLIAWHISSFSTREN